MKKHIVLLFLSDAKTMRDDHSKLSPAAYEGIDSICYTTNESAVKALLTDYWHTGTIKPSQIFIFATKKVSDPISDQISFSSVDLFKNQLRPLLPNIDEITYVENYNENDSGAVLEMQTIVDMAKKIQAYVARFPNDEFVLHADCTGGFRYAIMMTLNVIRLMQYSRVQIGRLIYSEFIPREKGRIRDIRNIYDLFDLTAGAEEFVRFGSIEAMLNYFHGKPCSPELRELLASMKNFSDAIKVCHAGTFTAAIHQLHLALNRFSQKEGQAEDPQVRLNDDLMSSLQDRVITDYQELWQNDELQVIRWCLNHDYLQQALTLYTERIPELLTDSEKGIFHLTEKGKASLKKDSTDKRNDNYYVFSVYDQEKTRKAQQAQAIQKSYKALRKGLKAICQSGSNAETVCQEIKGVLAALPQQAVKVQQAEAILPFLQTLQTLQKNPQPLKDLSTLRADVQQLVATYQEAVSATEWQAFVACTYGSQRIKKIKNFIQSHLQDATVKKIFAPVQILPEARQCWLCRQKLAESKIPLAQLDIICKEYNNIRDERNQSNHARKDKGQYTAEELKTYMKTALAHVEKVLS